MLIGSMGHAEELKTKSNGGVPHIPEMKTINTHYL